MERIGEFKMYLAERVSSPCSKEVESMLEIIHALFYIYTYTSKLKQKKETVDA